MVAFALWLGRGSDKPLALRVPGTDQAPGSELGGNANPVLAGKLIRSDGQPANSTRRVASVSRAEPGRHQPRNRQPRARLAAAGNRASCGRLTWAKATPAPPSSTGASISWTTTATSKQDALRCLSLADGREIWRYAYPVPVKRNHGMSRTVPAVTDKLVVAMGPKCHVVCLDSATGELRWGLDLVRQYGTTVPPWYAGQCPLIDNGAVILAPGGKAALLLACDAQTGKALWQTPNPHGWKMTHSSVMPMEFGGQRMYVYCANNGVVGVSAKDGSILWETTDWKISIATVPSPLILERRPDLPHRRLQRRQPDAAASQGRRAPRAAHSLQAGAGSLRRHAAHAHSSTTTISTACGPTASSFA